MDDIYNTLNNYLKTSSKNGISETIARFMLVSLAKIPSLRAADVAAHCHTSASSVVRFCRELGYDGYIEFKDTVDDYCQNVQDKILVPELPLELFGSEEEYTLSLEKWTKLMQEFTFCAMLAVDRQQVRRLAEDILHYRHVYLFGAGLAAQITESLRIHLARSGRIVMTMVTPRMDMPLTADRPGTLAVVFSQHGHLVQIGSGNEGMLEYLKKHCAKTWLVTQEPPQRTFPVDETIRLMASTNFELEYHTMLNFEEMLSEYCRGLLEQR